MVKPQTRKRLDKIEVELTPKQWAIMYADEIRRHPCGLDFLRAQTKGPYHESVCTKPYRALLDQAEARHPGQKPEDIRAKEELRRGLEREYQALTGLRNEINRGMEIELEESRLKRIVIARSLRALLWQNCALMIATLLAAWIKQHNVVESEENKRLLMLKELVAILPTARSTSLLSAQSWTYQAPKRSSRSE